MKETAEAWAEDLKNGTKTEEEVIAESKGLKSAADY